VSGLPPEKEPLPEGIVARIDITDIGVRFNLRRGMPATVMAETLRVLADALEDGSLQQVIRPTDSPGNG
jgi:hypothetical protein